MMRQRSADRQVNEEQVAVEHQERPEEPEQEGREDDRRVHDDAGERTEYERTGDLPEIRPQFPEILVRLSLFLLCHSPPGGRYSPLVPHSP